MKLTPEEESLLDSVERGEWQRVTDFPKESARYRETARATLRKDKRVNILHKYINGRLIEKPR